jgi:hypothetical protein
LTESRTKFSVKFQTNERNMTMFAEIKDFILRHLVWVLLITVGIIFLWVFFGAFFWQFIGTMLMCIIAEGVAIALSGIGTYAFTKINFTKILIEGDDKRISATERLGMMQVIGAIFIGVHFVVGIVSAGVYFAQFN